MNANSASSSRPQLWQTALDSLDSQLKTSLNTIADSHGGDIVTAILKEAERKKKLCLQKRWKIEFRGKTIVLRDLFDKIIAWVSQFKAVVDVAVQVDSGAASLPWAGVRFLLQVAVNERHCFESTIHGLELVSLLIARYAAFEALYLQQGSVLQVAIERCLVKLYARILTFLGHGVRYFSQSAASRLVKSLFQLSQDEEIDTIGKADEEVIKLAQMVDSQVQQQTQLRVDDIKAVVETLQRPVCRLVDVSSIYAKKLEEKQFRDILTWLSSVTYPQHHKRHSEDRLPNSSQWLFHHPQYMTWKGSSSSSLLLLHGIPGSGKTTLVSAVVDAFLSEHSANPRSAPIAYFYCGDSRFGRAWADPDELMRSLTRQFAVVDKKKLKVHEQVFLEYARREAEAKLDGFEMPRLQISECVQLILNILGANPAVIIVDAVDEIEECRRHELLDGLIRIRDESASVVKIFLSSRDNSNIFAGLPDALMLRVREADTQSDMELYVRHCVSEAITTRALLNGHVPDNLREELTKFLLKQAGEMFLWVKLQVERFSKLRSASSISEAIMDRSKRADTIDHLYSDILDHVQQADPVAYKTASRAFSWLLCMNEPLSCTAFIDAVSAVEHGDKYGLNLPELLAICSNMIVVDTQLDTLRFAHVTFKEYLETKPDFDIASAHRVAALCCLETCMHSLPIDIASDLQPNKEYSLYATLYWARHYIASSAVSNNSISPKLRQFIFDDDREINFAFQLWLEAVHQASEYLPNDHCLKTELNAVMNHTQTPFFTACIYGLKDIIHDAVQSPNLDIDTTNSLGHTGLYLAAAFGRHEIVHFLLDLGANADVSHGKYEDPLSAACANGHISVVRLLLSHDTRTPPRMLETALQRSFLAGHEKIAQLLLEKWIQNSSMSELGSGQMDYGWLVESTAQAGFTEVMEKLTKSPLASSLLQNKSRVVNAAIRKGQVAFIKRYMEKGPLPTDTIATAALFGKNDIITLCLDKGYSIEDEGPFGTPLRCASLMGHETAVRTLLSHGADVNAVTAFGDALQVAAMKGHTSVTDILIQHNADVDNSGGFFGNALQAAAYRGHRDVAQILLDAGASVYKKGRYPDAFHAAAEAGQEEIIGLLVERGYVLPERSYPGILAEEARINRDNDLLRQTSPSRDKFTYVRPSPKKIPVGATVSDFEDILSHAGGCAFHRVDESLAAYRRKRSYHPAESKSYALEVAAARGHSRTVQKILANREQLRPEACELGRALWAASRNGYTRLVGLITSAEVDLRYFVRGSLERAARHGHLEVIEILLRYEDTWGSPNRYEWGTARDCVDSEDETYQQETYVEDTFESQYTLPLVLSGCRGGQLSSVMRGFQLASQSEMEQLHQVALNEAVRFDHTEIVEFFLQNELLQKPEFLAQAMRTAAIHGSKSALALLLSKKYSGPILVEAYNGCLTDAIFNGQREIVQYLMDQQDKATCGPETFHKAFVYTARKGYLPITKLLTPEIQNSRQYPVTLAQALNVACETGQRDTAEFLIHAGADVNMAIDDIPRLDGENEHASKEQQTGTPLQACLRTLVTERKNKRLHRQQESVIRLLLEHGADVNQITGLETSPLHIAARKCSEETVRAMIARGAQVNIDVPKDGTPLQCAAGREVGSLAIVRALLEAGAVITFTSQDEQQQQYCPILDAALSFFGPDPSKKSNKALRYVRDDEGRGYFFESQSMEEVLSAGPGAVIKLLLLSQTEVRAIDPRFSLLLQMLAATGDLEFTRLLIDRGMDVNPCGHYYGCALQSAARFGHLDYVKLLLDAGAQVNLVKGAHGTPLQAAVIARHEEIVRELIAHGADVNLFASTPALQLSIKSESLVILKSLLEAGANVSDGPAALHLAVDAHNFEMAKMLLDAGADVNSQDSKHPPVLVTACRHGDMKIIELLLARGAYPDKKVEDCEMPLAVAASMGRLKIMKLLLEAGARIYDPPQGLNVLENALLGRKPQRTVQLLLQNLSDSPALIPACREALPAAYHGGDEESFLVILEKVPKNAQLLAFACRFGSRSVLKMIISHSVGVDSDLENGDRALHLAVYHQQLELVSFLLDQGADAQYVSSRYGAPISAALEGFVAYLSDGSEELYDIEYLCEMIPEEECPLWRLDSKMDVDSEILRVGKRQSSCEKMVRLLLRAGAQVNPVGRPLGAPLHVASYAGELSTVELLLDCGADINASEGYFGSALIAAMYNDRHAVFNFLLARGIDVDIRSERFGTALHYAYKHKDRRTVKVLLEHGADLNSDGSELESPVSALLSREDSEDIYNILELLLQYGDGLQISEADLVIAAKLPPYICNDGIFECLLTYADNVVVTQEVIGAVVSAEWSDPANKLRTVRKLLERAEGVTIDSEIFKSVREPEVLRVLLQHRPRCEITSEIFETLAGVRFDGRHLVKVVLEQEPQAVPTASVVLSCLKHESFFGLDDYPAELLELLQLLLDRNPELEVTDAMVTGVQDPDQLQVLLSRRSGVLHIHKDLLRSLVLRENGLPAVVVEPDPRLPFHENFYPEPVQAATESIRKR